MSEENKSFRVNDRRRFDEDGNERDSSSESRSSATGQHHPIQQHNPESQERKATTFGASQTAPSASAQSASGSVANPTTSAQTPPSPSTSGSASSASSQSDGASFVMQDTPKDAGEQGTGLSFSSFLMSLATQALMQMGEMEPPGGIKLPPDFEAAKQTIEVIGMLAVKTKGNLDAEEQRLLVEVLHSLRLTFVQRVKAAMSAAGITPPKMAQSIKR